jgi:hypothetical protein
MRLGETGPSVAMRCTTWGWISGGKRMQHFGGHFGIELDQQHGDRLRVFALDQRHERLRGEPARQFEREALAPRAGSAASGCRPSLADRAGHQATGPGRRGHARRGRAWLGLFDKAGDGLGDHSGPISPSAHIFSPSTAVRRVPAAQGSRRPGRLLEQHDHHRGAFGIAKPGRDGPRSWAGLRLRRASHVEHLAQRDDRAVGLLATRRWARPTCRPSSFGSGSAPGKATGRPSGRLPVRMRWPSAGGAVAPAAPALQQRGTSGRTPSSRTSSTASKATP